MLIHNFYADLLLSTRVLFDNFIFQNERYIRRYEFNIGNRSFQMPKDFTTQCEFPNIIAVINDETPAWGQRPDVSQSISGYNVDQVPVLYDLTNENVLYLQEEMVTVPISIIINCESPLQAKEIANVIRRWLPYNKYIQFLEYTSFLEMSKPFLSNSGFDINNDNIVNLYTKLNHRDGQIYNCFAVQYKPFIRLDGIGTTIPDSTQRSFQVSVDLTYMVQFPLHLFSSLVSGYIERIDISFSMNSFEPIADYPSAKMVNQSLDNVDELKKGYVRRQYLVYDNNSTENLIMLDGLLMQPTTITAKSDRLQATRTATNFIYITVDNDETRRYKANISNIPIDGITIPIDVDYYLILTSDDSGNISIGYRQKGKDLVIQFNKEDFIINPRYSYNLICGITIIKNFIDYQIDEDLNCITFSIIESMWLSLTPSLTRPLIIQFYDDEYKYPHSYGGIAPELDNIKIAEKNSTSVIITWTSGIETTTCVEYGPTAEYGFFTELNNNFVQTHKAVIYSLQPFTFYHYRVNTLDVDGNEIISEDFTFTTSP